MKSHSLTLMPIANSGEVFVVHKHFWSFITKQRWSIIPNDRGRRRLVLKSNKNNHTKNIIKNGSMQLV